MSIEAALSTVQVCEERTDCQELLQSAGLFLKPLAKLSITVTLPKLKMGQSISNWEITEKLRLAIKPVKFTSIKVTKSTLEFLRFEAEINNKTLLESVVKKIDLKGIKLSGFADLLKIRATEGKMNFPTRHNWDSFFRDAKHMNEMKAGERPDTVVLKGLPIRWFSQFTDPAKNRPSDQLIDRIMSQYGEIRHIDIPTNDPMRHKMSATISGLTADLLNTKDVLFTCFVQFRDYIGFDKCMHDLQGKKLVYMEDDKAWSCTIEIDFDRTKHLTDYCIKKRKEERERLLALDKEKQEKIRKQREQEELVLQKERERENAVLTAHHEKKEQKLKEKAERREKREQLRRDKKMRQKEKQLDSEADKDLCDKIAYEERKLLLAQRRLESIRLLDELLDRIKVVRQRDGGKKKEDSSKINKKNSAAEFDAEQSIRDELVSSLKQRQEAVIGHHKRQVTKAQMGQSRLSSVLPKDAIESISSRSISGNSSSDSDSDGERYKKKLKLQQMLQQPPPSHQGPMPPVAMLPMGPMGPVHMGPPPGGFPPGNWRPPNAMPPHRVPPPIHLNQQFPLVPNEPPPPNYPSFYQPFPPKEGEDLKISMNMSEPPPPNNFGPIPPFFDVPPQGPNNFYFNDRGRGMFRGGYSNNDFRGRGFFDNNRGRGNNINNNNMIMMRGNFRGRRPYQHYGNNNIDAKKKDNRPATWFKSKKSDNSSASRSRSRSRDRKKKRSVSRSRGWSWSSRSSSSRSRSRRSRSRSRTTKTKSKSRSRSRDRKSRSRSPKSDADKSESKKDAEASKVEKSPSKENKDDCTTAENETSAEKGKVEKGSRSRSNSKDNESRSRSKSRSHRRSRSGSRSHSKNRRSRSRSSPRSRSRNGSHCRVKSRSGSRRRSRSHSGSHRRSRSRSGSRRRSRSRSGSRRRSRSRSGSRRRSRSRSGSSRSRSKSRRRHGKHKKSRDKRGSDCRESDLELSSDPDEAKKSRHNQNINQDQLFGNPNEFWSGGTQDGFYQAPNFDGGFDGGYDGSFYNMGNQMGRGNRGMRFMNNNGSRRPWVPRQRGQPPTRGWQNQGPRFTGGFNNFQTFPQGAPVDGFIDCPPEFMQEPPPEPGPSNDEKREQTRMYQKYFNSLAEKEAARQKERSRSPDRRPFNDQRRSRSGERRSIPREDSHRRSRRNSIERHEGSSQGRRINYNDERSMERYKDHSGRHMREEHSPHPVVERSGERNREHSSHHSGDRMREPSRECIRDHNPEHIKLNVREHGVERIREHSRERIRGCSIDREPLRNEEYRRRHDREAAHKERSMMSPVQKEFGPELPKKLHRESLISPNKEPAGKRSHIRKRIIEDDEEDDIGGSLYSDRMEAEARRKTERGRGRGRGRGRTRDFEDVNFDKPEMHNKKRRHSQSMERDVRPSSKVTIVRGRGDDQPNILPRKNDKYQEKNSEISPDRGNRVELRKNRGRGQHFYSRDHDDRFFEEERFRRGRGRGGFRGRKKDEHDYRVNLTEHLVREHHRAEYRSEDEERYSGRDENAAPRRRGSVLRDKQRMLPDLKDELGLDMEIRRTNDRSRNREREVIVHYRNDGYSREHRDNFSRSPRMDKAMERRREPSEDPPEEPIVDKKHRRGGAGEIRHHNKLLTASEEEDDTRLSRRKYSPFRITEKKRTSSAVDLDARYNEQDDEECESSDSQQGRAKRAKNDSDVEESLGSAQEEEYSEEEEEEDEVKRKKRHKKHSKKNKKEKKAKKKKKSKK